MSKENLAPLQVKRKTGSECFHDGSIELDASLLDFWRWSASDLVSNVTRGVVAEYLVATAIGVDVTGVRDEWAAFDLTTTSGIKVEVKSAAYLQSWYQRAFSVISFRTPKTRSWDPVTNRQSEIARRQADVYVFALLAHKDKPTVSPLDVSQWHFYVLATRVLDARKRSQHSITLRTLESLSGGPVPFGDLQQAVEEASKGPRQF